MSTPPDADRTLWEGTPQNLTNIASGGRVIAVRYRLTPFVLHIDRGIVRSDAQQIPLASVYDIDVRQSMTQKARGVGDVLLHVDTGGHRETVTLESVSEPKQLRDYINITVANARQYYMSQNRQQVVLQTPSTPPAPTVGRPLSEELRDLAALKEAGVLTDEEFAAQKAKLLNR